MEMIVIYDMTGKIYYCAGGDVAEPVGIPFLRVNVPDGKRIKKVDTSVEIHVPVFEDEPKLQQDKDIDELKTRLQNVQNVIDFLIMN